MDLCGGRNRCKSLLAPGETVARAFMACCLGTLKPERESFSRDLLCMR